MTPSQILRKAKALIDTPEKWTQGAFARDAKGRGVETHDVKAVCFCSAGALGKVNHDGPNEPYEYLTRSFGGGLVVFNDTHTHAEVMAKWDEAIALAEADEVENGSK